MWKFSEFFSFGNKAVSLITAVLSLVGFATTGRALTVAWDPNPDADLAGYNLYFGEISDDPQRVDVGLNTSTQVVNLLPGKSYYFYATAYNTAGLESDPSATITYSVPVNVSLSWDRSPSLAAIGYNLYYAQTGRLAQKIKAGALNSILLKNFVPGVTYFFYVAAYNRYGIEIEGYTQKTYTVPTDGLSLSFSVHITRPSSITTAAFVGRDSTTMGSWKGRYGTDGHLILGNTTKYPPNIAMWVLNKNFWLWDNQSSDSSAIECFNSYTRVAACWYNTNAFSINLAFKDSFARRVSVYCVDFENSGVTQAIELINLDTGLIMDSRTISNFQDGIYLTWQVSGRVAIRARRIDGKQAVISGLYFEKPTLL